MSNDHFFKIGELKGAGLWQIVVRNYPFNFDTLFHLIMSNWTETVNPCPFLIFNHFAIKTFKRH
jgi:hypothetical protein